MSRDVTALGRHDDWSGIRAVVAGFGVTGFAAADNLTHLGASVVALDERAEGKEDRAELLGVLGADVRLGEGTTETLPDGAELLVVSPGWKPSSPVIVQARERGVPVWGEVELAWRLRDAGPGGHPAPWLAVTGTNGKTTTVQMLECILGRPGCAASPRATSGCRWSRPSWTPRRTTSWPSSSRASSSTTPTR